MKTVPGYGFTAIFGVSVCTRVRVRVCVRACPRELTGASPRVLCRSRQLSLFGNMQQVIIHSCRKPGAEFWVSLRKSDSMARRIDDGWRWVMIMMRMMMLMGLCMPQGGSLHTHVCNSPGVELAEKCCNSAWKEGFAPGMFDWCFNLPGCRRAVWNEKRCSGSTRSGYIHACHSMRHEDGVNIVLICSAGPPEMRRHTTHLQGARRQSRCLSISAFHYDLNKFMGMYECPVCVGAGQTEGTKQITG